MTLQARRVPLLIALVHDRSARPDERGDAASELWESDDPQVREALLRACRDVVDQADQHVAVAAGESLGEIATRTGPLSAEERASLHPDARSEYDRAIRVGSPPPIQGVADRLRHSRGSWPMGGV